MCLMLIDVRGIALWLWLYILLYNAEDIWNQYSIIQHNTALLFAQANS